MVSRTCDCCKKEGRANLYFFKPRGWIKHKTPDDIRMLFCSLACFQKFTGADLTSRPSRLRKRTQVEAEPLVEVPAQESG